MSVPSTEDLKQLMGQNRVEFNVPFNVLFKPNIKRFLKKLLCQEGSINQSRQVGNVLKG